MMKPSFSAASSSKVLKIIYDYEMSSCAYVAARLNIAELLYEKPRHVTELAQLTGTNATALYRVLRVLAGEGLFSESAPQVFSYLPAAAALHGETTGSVKYFLQAILGEFRYAFGNLLYSVRTGETGFDHHYGKEIWEYYQEHPEEALNFNKSMAGLTQYYSPAVISGYDFSQFRTIVDIGGGNGALLFNVLHAFPTVKGVIFDVPSVVEQAEQLIAENGLQERCSATSGDFFKAVPPGGDAYMMKYILHDWNDEQSVTILRNCAAVMEKGAKVVVLDSVIPAGDEWHPGKHMDATMLACTKGRERNEDEFRHIFTEAGLKFNKVVKLEIDEISIVEGEKV
ncbi:ArsR family transcriptional regulator [Chitinophaga sp. 212800010-3]|uniref:ArsR family transcriptional regulator n=1 Tax=unclassified Chitinophaga TaxID=2619133 RepID=UPI002E114335